MNILVNGPQGSGKTTQAKKIAEKFNLNFIDSGTIFRNSFETDLGKQAKEYMDRGELVRDDLVFKIIKEYIDRNCDLARGFVVVGVPRNIDQIPFMEDTLNIKFDKVVNLVVGEEVFMKRIKQRFLEEGRTDETDEALKKRLSWYNEKTGPVIEHYREVGIVIDIDGEPPIDEISKEIINRLS